MYNTRDLDEVGATLIDILSFLASPRRDQALLREAGVELDRALFPLLVLLGRRGPLAVAELSDAVGRDHTTVSRQLARLRELALVGRLEDSADRRRNTAQLTEAGEAIVRSIAAARRRLLAKVLEDWSAADLATLARLNRRFADALNDFVPKDG